MLLLKLTVVQRPDPGLRKLIFEAWPLKSRTEAIQAHSIGSPTQIPQLNRIQLWGMFKISRIVILMHLWLHPLCFLVAQCAELGFISWDGIFEAIRNRSWDLMLQMLQVPWLLFMLWVGNISDQAQVNCFSGLQSSKNTTIYTDCLCHANQLF